MQMLFCCPRRLWYAVFQIYFHVYFVHQIELIHRVTVCKDGMQFRMRDNGYKGNFGVKVVKLNRLVGYYMNRRFKKGR